MLIINLDVRPKLHIGALFSLSHLDTIHPSDVEMKSKCVKLSLVFG